jgi:hypothetical protein
MRASGLVLLLVAGCSGSEPTLATDAGSDPADATAPTSSDAAAAPTDGGSARPDATDRAPAGATLADARDRLLSTLTEAPCATWAAFDESQRAVFLTLTHRLYVSRTADGAPMLSHVDALLSVRGGGADGRACGSATNNRLFLSMDAYLWRALNDAWNGVATITDGGDGHWARTRDLAGPHDPFDASSETETGLECRAFLIEGPGSRPPTAQAHFFTEGAAAPVERGDILLPADPYLLELDHDFDCFHQSNPLCPLRGFDDLYRESYGDFECDWTPTGCRATGDGCYRSVVTP